MKRVLAVVFAVALLGLAAHSANAQVPNMQVYFNSHINQAQEVCQGMGAIQTWYVVANNLNNFIKSIEYAVSYPPAVTWLADLPVTDTIVFGTTPTGVGQAFTDPGDGFGPLVVIKVLVSWNCEVCGSGAGAWDQPVVAIPHPGTGFLRAVRWPDDFIIQLTGMTSIICPQVVPVEETSWGQLKALYED